METGGVVNGRRDHADIITSQGQRRSQTILVLLAVAPLLMSLLSKLTRQAGGAAVNNQQLFLPHDSQRAAAFDPMITPPLFDMSQQRDR
jgi:hypothetical protein